mmetsp:Transcript_13198/g.37143  ORF Transcript_13198/g.37143 Transcript_13198/m.37143 type:complete len:230 (-) Transcript_13198:1230-1919(-)
MGASDETNDAVGGGIACDGFREGIKGEDTSASNSATASISSLSSVSSDDNDGIKTSSPSIGNGNGNGNQMDGKSKDLWWIHGNGYDLMDFVKDHPGGTEAILLGKGRDCTALVESYHAFSGDRVWKILEKHRYVQEEKDADERPGRVPDFFYELLKKRATKVLRSKGIDPVRDRGASRVRSAYYLAVFGSWLYTGYLHCAVSVFSVLPSHKKSYVIGHQLRILRWTKRL